MLGKDKYKKGDIFLRRYSPVKGVQEGSWTLGRVTGKSISPKAIVVFYDPIKVIGIEPEAAVSRTKGEAYFIVGTGFESRIFTHPHMIIREVFQGASGD